jgi:dihydroorotase
MKRILILIALASVLGAQPRYDLLLQGGHVIDAKNNISAARDVAIRDGKISAVADHIEPMQAFKVVIVRGLYVRQQPVSRWFYASRRRDDGG